MAKKSRVLKNYVLIETVNDSSSISDYVLASSVNKGLIFREAAKLCKKEVKSKSTWRTCSYSVNVYDTRTGRKLDELEFDSNGRQERTFGKIVRNMGTRDEKVVGSWRK